MAGDPQSPSGALSGGREGDCPTWGALRLRTPFGPIYIARTDGDHAYLNRRPREDGEGRVVFTLEEFSDLFRDCEEKNLNKQERLEFFAEIRCVKMEIQGSRFEKIGRPEEFAEGDILDLGEILKEVNAREVREKKAASKKIEKERPSGKGNQGDDEGNRKLAY